MSFNKHHGQLIRHVETICFWPCISIHSCNHLPMKCTGLQVTLLYCKHMEENMEKTNGQNCIHIFFGSNSKIWSLTFFVQYIWSYLRFLVESLRPGGIKHALLEKHITVFVNVWIKGLWWEYITSDSALQNWCYIPRLCSICIYHNL